MHYDITILLDVRGFDWTKVRHWISARCAHASEHEHARYATELVGPVWDRRFITIIQSHTQSDLCFFFSFNFLHFKTLLLCFLINFSDNGQGNLVAASVLYYCYLVYQCSEFCEINFGHNFFLFFHLHLSQKRINTDSKV